MHNGVGEHDRLEGEKVKTGEKSSIQREQKHSPEPHVGGEKKWILRECGRRPRHRDLVSEPTADGSQEKTPG